METGFPLVSSQTPLLPTVLIDKLEPDKAQGPIGLCPPILVPFLIGRKQLSRIKS